MSKNFYAEINYPIEVNGKSFKLISAVIGKDNGEFVIICGHTIQAVRDVWELIQENSPSVPDLDESRMQEVIISGAHKVKIK